jgi:hypothetical protein
VIAAQASGGERSNRCEPERRSEMIPTDVDELGPIAFAAIELREGPQYARLFESGTIRSDQSGRGRS